MQATAHLRLLGAGSGPAAPKPRMLERGRAASNVIVIKVSGKLLEDEGNCAAIAVCVKRASAKGNKVILIHDGEKQIGEALLEAKIPAMMRDGERVAGPKAMCVVRRVLEDMNGKLADALKKQGLEARQSGIAGGAPIVHAEEPMSHGEPEAGAARVGRIDRGVLRHELARCDVIVMSPLGYQGTNDDYRMLDLNADKVAAYVAGAIGARGLVVLSDGPAPPGENAGGRALLAAARSVPEVVSAGSIAALAGIIDGSYDGATRIAP